MYQNNTPTVHPAPGTATVMPTPFPSQLPEGEWSSGLFDCLDDRSICLRTAVFPCWTMGKIAHIVDRGTISCCAGGVLYGALAYAGCASLLGCVYRTKLRQLFSLPETPLSDGLVTCLCCFCALCQDYRELKNRGADPSIGWEANVEKWKQEGSTMAPLVSPEMNR